MKPSNDNKKKFVKALAAADFDDQTLIAVDRLDFESTLIFTIGEEPQKVDFLTHVSGIEYDSAEKNKVIGDIDGMNVPVVHIKDLVVSKMSTDRAKDRMDVEELQKIVKNKK